MIVKTIATTYVDSDALESIGLSDSSASGADFLAEFAGRNCYQSFDRPNPATRENKDYLKHIIDVGHESVLEHASVTFYIETSRSVLTELERHRHLSFSVVSQRYVDPTELGIHWPPVLDQADLVSAALYELGAEDVVVGVVTARAEVSDPEAVQAIHDYVKGHVRLQLA